jgi:hypothetical protein
MDTRPILIKEPIYAFRQSDLSFKINYVNLPEMPNEIKANFWVDEILLLSHPAEIQGAVATFLIPANIISLFPSYAQVYFLHDGISKFGGSFIVNMGASPNPSTLELSVTIGAGQEFTVELVGLDAVKEQVFIAIQKAEQTAEDRAATEEARVATEAARDDTITGLNAKTNYREVEHISDLTFPLPKGIIVVHQDDAYGDENIQSQFYYSDGLAVSANDLWLLPMTKRSTVIGT